MELKALKRQLDTARAGVRIRDDKGQNDVIR